MKALYIYNPHSTTELELIERAKSEMNTYIKVISINDVAEETRSLVSTTPALLIVSDDLQGEELTKDSADGSLIATSMLYKRLEEEELCIHQAETFRLDNFIKIEKKPLNDVIDKLILESLVI